MRGGGASPPSWLCVKSHNRIRKTENCCFFLKTRFLEGKEKGNEEGKEKGNEEGNEKGKMEGNSPFGLLSCDSRDDLTGFNHQCK